MSTENFNGYAYEKMMLAIQSLINSKEDIKSALINADNFQLDHIKPENDLPDELHDLFIEIEEHIMLLRSGSEDEDHDTVAAISKLLQLFGLLHRHEKSVPY